MSLVLRLGGGEPLFGIPALIPYPEWVPFKTVAAGVGLILLPVVSRLTAAVDQRRRRNPPDAVSACRTVSCAHEENHRFTVHGVRDCRPGPSMRGREPSFPRRTAGPAKAPVRSRR